MLIPTLSVAVAAIVVVPESVVPAVGDVRETTGKTVSVLETVTVIGVEVVLVEASYAFAVKVYVPLGTVVVFHGYV